MINVQFEKINAIITRLVHSKNYYLLNLFYKKGIIKAFVYSSTLRKLKTKLNNLLKAKFEIKEKNNLFEILEINDEEFLLKDLNYKKLILVNFWIKLIELSFDTGESFELLLEAIEALNYTNEKQSDFVDIQFKIRFLIKKDLLLIKSNCFRCNKKIKDNYHYDEYINSFYCKDCVKNKNYYINNGSFCYLDFTTKKIIQSITKINLVNESKRLLNNMIKNKFNNEFNRTLIK